MWLSIKALLLIVVAIGSGLATALNAVFGPRARARKRLRSAPRELTDGAAVTLTGVVRAKAAMVTAPLSGREVVAFSAMARIYAGSGRSREVVDRVHQQQMVDFVLDTADGPVEIEAARAELELPPEPIIPRKLAREQAFLAAAGCTASARDVGFDEIAIMPGATISVHGVVRIEAAPSEDYRATSTRIVLSSHPAHTLTIGRPL